MIYTPKTPFDSTPGTKLRGGAGVVVRQEGWSDNAEFDAGEYITIKSFLNKIEKGTETKNLYPLRCSRTTALNSTLLMDMV